MRRFFITGLLLLALKRARSCGGQPEALERIGWLATKEQDGTWPVNYLNGRRDPQNNIGMFMRDAATAFAILALTEPP